MVSSSAGRWAYSAASARRSCAGNTAKADGDAMCCLHDGAHHSRFAPPRRRDAPRRPRRVLTIALGRVRGVSAEPTLPTEVRRRRAPLPASTCSARSAAAAENRSPTSVADHPQHDFGEPRAASRVRLVPRSRGGGIVAARRTHGVVRIPLRPAELAGFVRHALDAQAEDASSSSTGARTTAPSRDLRRTPAAPCTP